MSGIFEGLDENIEEAQENVNDAKENLMENINSFLSDQTKKMFTDKGRVKGELFLARLFLENDKDPNEIKSLLKDTIDLYFAYNTAQNAEIDPNKLEK